MGKEGAWLEHRSNPTSAAPHSTVSPLPASAPPPTPWTRSTVASRAARAGAPRPRFCLPRARRGRPASLLERAPPAVVGEAGLCYGRRKACRLAERERERDKGEKEEEEEEITDMWAPHVS